MELRARDGLEVAPNFRRDRSALAPSGFRDDCCEDVLPVALDTELSRPKARGEEKKAGGFGSDSGSLCTRLCGVMEAYRPS